MPPFAFAQSRYKACLQPRFPACRDEEHGSLQQKLAEAEAQLAETGTQLTRERLQLQEHMSNLSSELETARSAGIDSSRERSSLQTRLSNAETRLSDMSPMVQSVSSREAENAALSQQVGATMHR